MSAPELAALAESLASVAKAVWPHARRLYRERQAGKMPLANHDDLLEQGLNETFARLSRGQVDDAWWRRLLNHIGHSLIAPEFLRRPALQEWLADPQVQSDFKALARARVMGADGDDEQTLTRLRQAYEEKTGEHGRFAQGPIDIVLAVLVAGYISSIEPPLVPIAGMIQANAAETREGLARISSRLEEIAPKTDPHHTSVAKGKLNLVLKRRSLDLARARDDIRNLVQRIFEGDLCYAGPSVRAEALYWAARLCAQEKDLLPVAKEYLIQLKSEDSSFDTRLIEALILEMEGNVDGALRLLRDTDTPDGRATLFTVLCRRRGDQTGLKWFDEQPRRDDPDFLTGVGWANVAVTLAKSDRWEESAARLAAVQDHVAEWPDLAFIEGVINAALLLPGELRPRALQMELFHPAIRTVRGSAADTHRAWAHVCFERASCLLVEVDAQDRARAAEDWRLWLRLTDPDLEIVKVARQEVQEGMKDGRRAVDLLPFARRFGIPFDTAVLQRYLAQRTRLGGLEGRDLVAELMLAETTMSPRDFVGYLEQEETRLAKSIPMAALVGMRAENLIRDGQPARAKRFLDERKSDLAERDYERLSAIILAEEGEDPLPLLENLYHQTGTLLDLENLIEHLWKAGDWAALHPLIERLFQLERTPDNARRLIECLRRNPTGGQARIVEFFEQNPDVTDWAPDLASAKAWALFHTGRLKEARTINDALRRNRTDPADLQLDINLAIQSGEWERFPAIIEQEWARRGEQDAHLLLRLALLAGQTDATADRACELAKLAVSKAQDDAKVLVNAYGLAVQLGREGEVETGWIARAAELSSAEGPVWKVDIRVIAEQMVPAHRERTRMIEQNLMRGDIPLHMAAEALNMPLARLLIDIPRRNTEQQDGRRRIVIPIISGARQGVNIEIERVVGLDVTALMVLGYLGLLGPALDALGHVVLAPDTMSILLEEGRRVRFHQPSRVKHAEAVRHLIDQGRLVPVGATPESPSWLIDEVGRDLAEMLHAARTEGGHVVRPRPIFKLDTLLEKEADLRDYAELVLSTSEFGQMLFDSGRIDRPTYDRAIQYFAAHDRSPNGRLSLDATLLDRSLYLDDLAVTYLQHAGLLDAACRHGASFRVHPSLRAEQDAIIAANREGERLAKVLDDIRIVLRDALASGKAALLPWNDADGGDDKQLASLSQFLADAGPCDVICVDDRYINRHSVLTDQKGRSVPIVCVLDVLRYLESQGVLDSRKRRSALHQLREAGFVLVSIETAELDALLRAARFDQEERIIESAELRVLRQAIMRIRSLDLVNIPLEEPFLGRLQLTGVQVIRRLWQDGSLSPEQTASLSDWVWRNLVPSPIDWSRNIRDPKRPALVRDAVAHHLGLLLTPIPGINDARRRAFLDWVDHEILEPLLPANASLIDGSADLVRQQIEQWSEEYGADETSEKPG